MRNADLAMYKAKSAGGGGYAAYHPDMLAGLVARLELEADLRLALERGQLQLHYQPTIDLASSEVIGFEALDRSEERRVGKEGGSRWWREACGKSAEERNGVTDSTTLRGDSRE